jgi:CRP/FNR family transcriptional regulator, cyclic AMP receptor protein
MTSTTNPQTGMSAVSNRLLEISKLVNYPASKTIVAQGDDCSDVHYVCEGIVKLTLVSKRGRTAVLGILAKGDFFGEQCITGEATHLTSAIALVPTTIGVIKRQTMLRLIQNDRTIATQFLNYLLARNSRIQQDLIDHIFNSSEKRLARTLLLLSEYGETVHGESILKGTSQDSLAEMVGTTRQRINFFMNKFRRLGFIHYNGGVKINESLRKVLQD